MTRSIGLLTVALLTTLAASIFDILTRDPLIRGPLTAVTLAFLLPGTLLLSVKVGRMIDAMPSKSPELDRIGFILGSPRVLFGILAMGSALIAPFVALGRVCTEVVRGDADLLPLASLLVAPMLLVVGDVWLRRGLRIHLTPVQRMRIGPWEIDALPLHVKVLLLSSGIALATSLLAFAAGALLLDVGKAQLAWHPRTSITFFLISIPLAVLLLSKGRRGKKR
jgi:hypothetical protein